MEQVKPSVSIDQAARRRALLRAVVEDCLRRRAAGEPVLNDDVTRAHADLMPELGEELAILAVIERARSAFGSPPDGSSSTGDPTPTGVSIPGYRITSQIHHGGQGVVYEGVQQSTGRVVAINVMRQGPMATVRDRIRFEREVRILARLEHPNIVTVLDSGSSGACDYFVMDRIRGLPIDQFVRGSAETDSQRIRIVLAIMAGVCEAVHAAHLRGIIHRDLKPANILVVDDGSTKADSPASGATPFAIPKILDFGLAKTSEDSDVSLTVTGQFVGSLPWSSPEAAEGRHDFIDVRTDVYSLGVILYQLLANRFPYPVQGTVREIMLHIAQTEPPRPSTFNHDVDEDVDTIVKKCLAKDPARRYQSAGDLARDLRHALAGEPIEVRRDSFAYVLRKSLRRHRAAVGIAAAFVLVSMIGLAASISGWRSASRALRASISAQEREHAAQELARSETKKAQAVNEFVNRMLASPDPELSANRTISVQEVLDNAVRELDGGTVRNEPDVEASIRMTLGQSYCGLSRYTEAESQFRKALEIREKLHGHEHRDVADAIGWLGAVSVARDDYQQAVELRREALELFRKVHAGDHADTASALSALAEAEFAFNHSDAAVEHCREALAVWQRLGAGDTPDAARVRVQLASMSHGGGESIELFRSAIETFRRTYGDKHPEVARTLRVMGGQLHMQGDYRGAEKAYLESLSLSREIFGENSTDVLNCYSQLQLLYMLGHDDDKCEGTMREALPIAEKVYGRTSHRYAQYLADLASTLSAKRKFDLAIPMFRDALNILGQIEPGPSSTIAVAQVGLAMILAHEKQCAEAETLCRACIDTPVGADLPAEHWTRGQAHELLGDCAIAQARYAEAETLLLKGRELLIASRVMGNYREWSVKRLIRLYEAWDAAEPGKGHDSQAAEWKAKLELQRPSTQPSSGVGE